MYRKYKFFVLASLMIGTSSIVSGVANHSALAQSAEQINYCSDLFQKCSNQRSCDAFKQARTHAQALVDKCNFGGCGLAQSKCLEW